MELAFLTYIPRSGSTLLARLLCEHEGICVSQSGKFPDGIYRAGLKASSPQELPQAVERIHKDIHFKGWGFSKKETLGLLSTLPLPLQFEDFLPAILQEHCSNQGHPANIAIYKNNRYIKNVEELRDRFPGSKFIFLMRDPRGIFNSTRKNIDIRTGKIMNTNPLSTAINFNMICKSVVRYQSKQWFHLLRFEDLVSSPERQIESLLQFLETPVQKKEGTYAQKIPEGQWALHKNVPSSPNPLIAQAWEKELTKQEKKLIESVTADNLEAFGYPKTTAGSPFQLWSALLRHSLRAPGLLRSYLANKFTA